MKKRRKVLLVTSILLITVIMGFVVFPEKAELFKGLNLLIVALVIVVGFIALTKAIRNDKEEKDGIPAEDELSNLLKYKAGYLAYSASMYMWLFIFLFKDKFPDIETMLGGGILLSVLIGTIIKFVVKRNLNA